MAEEILIERIFSLLTYSDTKIKGEATWVLTNAILLADDTMRAQFVKKYQSDLVNALVIRLRDEQDLDKTTLLLEVMHAMTLLLELDQ